MQAAAGLWGVMLAASVQGVHANVGTANTLMSVKPDALRPAQLPPTTAAPSTTKSKVNGEGDRLGQASVGWRVAANGGSGDKHLWCPARVIFLKNNGDEFHPLDEQCELSVTHSNTGLEFTADYMAQNAFSYTKNVGKKVGCVQGDIHGTEAIGFICESPQEIKEVRVLQEGSSEYRAMEATLQVLHNGDWVDVQEAFRLGAAGSEDTIWQRASCKDVCDNKRWKDMPSSQLPLTCDSHTCSVHECCTDSNPPSTPKPTRLWAETTGDMLSAPRRSSMVAVSACIAAGLLFFATASATVVRARGRREQRVPVADEVEQVAQSESDADRA